MAVLRVDHPDIFQFAESKIDMKSMTNFNISVGVTDEFMEAVERNDDFFLKDPRTQRKIQKIKALELFNKLSENAWTCGDPGIIFLDRVNLFNPTPQEGPMESTNPCGEKPLLPFESCNLGSLNLGVYISGNENKKFNWNFFMEDVHSAVRFLDNIIDQNHYPLPQCKKITLKNRKIGLGVMGFADLLLKLEIPYSSQEAVKWGELIMSVLDREAKAASHELALERGAFPNWKGSLWQQLGYPILRNATVSTVAPTGTISIIAGASSGIEPIFSGVFYRNVLSGDRLVEVHPTVQQILEARGLKASQITDEVIDKELGSIWSPSRRISVEQHVKIQAAFQRHSDSAVSKTVNLPQQAKVEDVKKAYLMAHQKGCKGITVYRDQSRPTQVLDHSVAVSPEPEGSGVCPDC